MWEWYTFGGGPGHESKYEDQDSTGAARERKHGAAPCGRQHHDGDDKVESPSPSESKSDDKRRAAATAVYGAQGGAIKQSSQQDSGTQHILKRDPSAVSRKPAAAKACRSNAPASGRDWPWQNLFHERPLHSCRPVVRPHKIANVTLQPGERGRMRALADTQRATETWVTSGTRLLPSAGKPHPSATA